MVLDLPIANDYHQPIPKTQTELPLLNPNNTSANKPETNVTFHTTNESLVLHQIQSSDNEVPKKKEKLNKSKAITSDKSIEMEIEPQEQSRERKDEITNNTNVNTPPKLKIMVEVETTSNNTNITLKQKRNIAEKKDGDFTPLTKKGAKRKRMDSDDDDEYTPDKKSAKKLSGKKRGRTEDEEEKDDWTPNKRRKDATGSPTKQNNPRYYFATYEKYTFPRENGELIAGDVKSWITALENLPEKNMTPSFSEDKVENSNQPTPSVPSTPEAKRTKLLKKSPSQIKIEKPSHKVDVEKFYECLRPIDWTHQTPDKASNRLHHIY